MQHIWTVFIKNTHIIERSAIKAYNKLYGFMKEIVALLYQVYSVYVCMCLQNACILSKVETLTSLHI